jgi:hypothetical protein
VYLVRGPSGWPETFPRELADQTLIDFLTPLDLTTMLDAFQHSMATEHRVQLTWDVVVGYLGKITQCPGKSVPEIAAVAFWGQLLLYTTHEDLN